MIIHQYKINRTKLKKIYIYIYKIKRENKPANFTLQMIHAVIQNTIPNNIRNSEFIWEQHRAYNGLSEHKIQRKTSFTRKRRWSSYTKANQPNFGNLSDTENVGILIEIECIGDDVTCIYVN